MEMKLKNVTPEPEDRIVFEREDGRFDVQSVNAAGEREIRRKRLSLKDAHEIAVVGAHEDAGRVLSAHHSAPESVVLYNLPK